jgi:hypothetical protein
VDQTQVPNNAGGVPLSINDNDHRFLPFVHQPYVYSYFHDRKAVGGGLYTSTKFLPFVGLGYFNIELLWPALLATFRPNRFYRADAWGNFSYPGNGLSETRNQPTDSLALYTQSPHLQQIRQFCAARRIQLVMYYSPKQNTTLQVPDPGTWGKNERFLNYCSLIDNPAQFYDVQHVNRLGRAAVTAKLAADVGPLLQQAHQK